MTPGSRCGITPNIEHFRFGLRFAGAAGPAPHILGFAGRDYGPRAGIWRMLEILDTYEIRATVALISDVCRFYPRSSMLAMSANEGGWDMVPSHGDRAARYLAGPPFRARWLDLMLE